VLGYKTSLDAQMLDSQYVDFSNPNADKITSNTTSTISVKQETLEEAAEECLTNNSLPTDGDFAEGYITGAMFGAIWQQERMYSEEDMAEAFIACWKANVPDGIECKVSFNEWFEQFKKK
jgi:hypothetical protein